MQNLPVIVQGNGRKKTKKPEELTSPAPEAQTQAQQTLHMIGNAHIDPVWLWRWTEGFHEVRATFASALQLMNEFDDFVFISSAAAYYEWIEQNDPQMFSQIQQRVAEGRWGLVGGWWIQADCNIPGGESLARQALYAQRYFQEKFGKIATTGYNVDSFGHNGTLPQLLVKSGMDAYIFMRPSPHEKGLPGRLFWWEADDLSRVLAYRIPYEYCSWPKDIEKHVRRCAEEIHAPLNELMCFYGVGNHGGGPTRENLESIRGLDARGELPALKLSLPEEYFMSVHRQGIALPVVHDDLQHHASGCYAAHSGIKRWNRQAENALITAEKFSALAAWATGQPYPTNLAQAWKNVLFNQFHDILAGTCVEEAYEDARDMHGEAMSIAGRALNLALQSIGWRINIAPEEGMLPLVFFNPHAWQVQTNVEVETGGELQGRALLDCHDQPVPFQQVQSLAAASGRRRISFMVDLPPLGYAVYRLVERELEADSTPVPATDTTLENEFVRLEVDPQSGYLTSLFDKRHQVEVLAGPAARPVVIEDNTDTWGHNQFRFDREAGAFQAESVQLVAHGPVKSVIRVTSRYHDSRLEQEFTLYPDRAQVDVQVTVDWREQFKMLKLRFPLNLQFMRAVAETPYGSMERFANGEEQPMQSWIDVSGISRSNGVTYGLSLLNDSKYSYDVFVREIGLTVLRSPVYANHMPVTPEPGGHYTFIDQGVQHFRYSLLPHAGSWETAGTVRRAAELNQAPLTLPATFHEGPFPLQDSYLQAEPENIVVSAIKRAEDGDDLIIRAYESSKTATRGVIRLPKWGRVIEAGFGQSEIKTFRVPHDASLPVVETNLLEWEVT